MRLAASGTRSVRRSRVAHLSRRGLVAAEDAQEVGDFGEMGERLLAALLLQVADEVEVEEVLPRAAAQGPRFHFRQIDVPQREDAQAFVECAGSVAGREDDGDLVTLQPRRDGSGEQEEAREVLVMILEMRGENPGPIDAGRDMAGDGGG